MASEKPPGFWVYTALLALISLLLSVVGYLSIAKFDGVERTIQRMAESQENSSVRLAGIEATINAWTKQNFVPRDLFNALRDELERRVGALERKG